MLEVKLYPMPFPKIFICLGPYLLCQEFLKDYCENSDFISARRKILRQRAGLTEEETRKATYLVACWTSMLQVDD